MTHALPTNRLNNMTIHLLKLCVGIDNIDDLRECQAGRLRNLGEIVHITRMVPKRSNELTGGGSLYWVIKGHIQARQRILDIIRFSDDEGIKRCRLLLDSDLIPVHPQPRRPFQGWRYLDPHDAPPDLPQNEAETKIPEKMRDDLMELGLL